MLAFILAAAVAVSGPLSSADLVSAINDLIYVSNYNLTKDQWKSDPSRKGQCNAELTAEEAAKDIRDQIFNGDIILHTMPHYTIHALSDGEKHFLEGEARKLDSVALSHKYDCGL